MIEDQQQAKTDKIIQQDHLIYSINEQEMTASVIDNELAKGNIIIPYSINCDSVEYIVTKICENAFKESKLIKSIQFPIDSKLQTIEKNAFLNSSIKSISIPSSLIELNEDWCHCTSQLTKINVSPNNPRYSVYDDKFIIGKSSIENDEFDELVFCIRDIKKVTIPSFIKIILPCSFEKCINLEIIEFPENSELKTIEDNAFFRTSIKRIKFPKQLVKIGEESFNCCKKLEEVEFPFNSELQIIDKYSFSSTPINSFTIPSNLKEINEGCFFESNNLNEIKVDERNKNFKLIENKILLGKSSIDKDEFDVLVFAVRNIKEVTIPSFIKIIAPSAFNHCTELKKVEIQPDSKLEIIGRDSFCEASIEKIFIPHNVKIIDKQAFDGCTNLEKVEIPSDSKLEIIDDEAFNETSIVNISLPLHLKKIGENAFISENLKKVEIPIDSELKIIGKGAFSYTLIKSITIPKNLTEIGVGWCENTVKLNSINVSPNNPLFISYNNQLILKKSSIESENFDVLVFCIRNAKNVSIPSFVKIIEPFAFECCDNLRKIEIPLDSNLQVIKARAFCRSSIKTIRLPIHLTKIEEAAFSGCGMLRKIEIPKNSDLKTIDNYAFSNTLIESFSIPSNLVDLKDGCINGFSNLKSIRIDPKNPRYTCFDDKYILGKSSLEQKEYDCLIYARRDIKSATIPFFIKKISQNAFSDCVDLREVEFSPDSQLQIIDQFAFYDSSIDSISLPYHLTEIRDSAFNFCSNLRKIEIPKNSELRKIDNFAVSNTLVKSIYFPPHLIQVDQLALSNIQIIEIDENSEFYELSDISILIDKIGIIMVPSELMERFNNNNI